MPSTTTHVTHIRWFDDLGLDDVPLVGGKNASLGEMYRELSAQGVKVPNGFAITAEAYCSRAWIPTISCSSASGAGRCVKPL
jgi:hypothetical protein